MNAFESGSPRRVVGLFPHPDDEAYSCGGTLSLCARAGHSVFIGCATRGEKGSDRNSNTPSGAPLAALRSRELETACQILGTAAPTFFDLPDGSIAQTERRVAIDAVSTFIDQCAPDVVITLGYDGVYGHFDHLAWTDIVGEAVVRHDSTIRLLHVSFAKGVFAPVWRALSRRPGPSIVAPAPADGFGIDVAAADVRVDIRSVRWQKLSAVAAHRSQLPGGDPLGFLKPLLLEKLLDTEWFVHVAGPPLPAAAASPFAGL